MEDKKYTLLPADDAVQNWFEENIQKDCGASSAIYKFRQWLRSLPAEPQHGAVWMKGDYDRLYDQLKADPEKRIPCYVDYEFRLGDNKKHICRDICTIIGERMEFVSRGHGYGSVEFMPGDEKINFVTLCAEMNVEWLDESGQSKEGNKETAIELGENEYPDLSSATPQQKAETISGLIELTAREVMKMFYAFGLKTHIECTVIKEPTNEEFEFVFRKKSVPLTQSRADFIREVNGRDLQGMEGSKERDAAIKQMVDFVRDCATNWDCDTDGHTYNTGCRKCEANKINTLWNNQNRNNDH